MCGQKSKNQHKSVFYKRARQNLTTKRWSMISFDLTVNWEKHGQNTYTYLPRSTNNRDYLQFQASRQQISAIALHFSMTESMVMDWQRIIDIYRGAQTTENICNSMPPEGAEENGSDINSARIKEWYGRDNANDELIRARLSRKWWILSKIMFSCMFLCLSYIIYCCSERNLKNMMVWRGLQSHYELV
jgi:hypothetical protein